MVGGFIDVKGRGYLYFSETEFYMFNMLFTGNIKKKSYFYGQDFVDVNVLYDHTHTHTHL